MKKCNIYYYHPLSLTFKTSQTLQVVRDYYYLSRLGYKVTLYGKVQSKEELEKIYTFLKDSKVKVLLSSFLFFIKLLFDNQAIVVTRHYRKLSKVIFLKKLFKKKLVILHEMHEESFPYLLKKHIKKDSIYKLFNETDGIIFTNYSQEELYEKEFSKLPIKSVVLPNGVEIERFSKAKRGDKYIVTYLGLFNKWKNVELIFESFSKLDKKYKLRIAGGKGDLESKEYIFNLMKKYNIDSNRVDFMGYVDNQDVVEKVLNGSTVLLLPLGDNIKSKYLTSPMKLFEYMSTQVPVVAVNYPTVSMICDDNEVFLSNNNAIDFSNAIKNAIENDNKEKVLKMNKKVKLFSYEQRSLRYDKFIESII